MADLLGSWLLTYLLHSTLLLGGTWLLLRIARRMPVAWEEALWRTALFGGLLTASLQLALDVDPAGGRVAMPTLAAPTVDDARATIARDDATALETFTTALGAPETATGTQPEPVAEPAAAAPTFSPAARPADGVRSQTAAWLLAAWLAGGVWLLVRHMRARGRLRARLAGRTPLARGPLRASLDGLGNRAGLRTMPALSTVPGLGSPLAVGVLAPEIVVPARATDELTPGQQEAMLAHELAHHVRRDALWHGLARLVAGVLFIQPLNHLARRRLHDTAELLCDAWAVERTGCSRSLAECLTVVAGWMVGCPARTPAPAMAAHGSMLTQRVRRLVEHDLPSVAPRVRAALLLLALLPMIAVAWAAPAVAIGAADGSYAAAPELPLAPAREAPVRSVTAAPTLDEEIALLETELTTLLTLLTRVQEPPPALTAGAARLRTRLDALKSRRAALARVAAHIKEMSR